jgi:hypothetical protein
LDAPKRLARAVAEVVEHDDLIASIQKLDTAVASDVARAPSDEDGSFHALIPSLREIEVERLSLAGSKANGLRFEGRVLADSDLVASWLQRFVLERRRALALFR